MILLIVVADRQEIVENDMRRMLRTEDVVVGDIDMVVVRNNHMIRQALCWY